MATYVPAKVSTQYIFFASLVSQANTKIMQVNPTIAAGDFKVSIDGAALANLATLPAVTPAGSSMVKFTLSTSEMAGANATIVCSDAAGSEWCDLTINVPTTARQIDDLAFPTVSGRSLDVTATGEAGIDWNNIGAPTTTVNLSGTSTKAVEPTVAGRTLDVSATGEAGVDWGNVGSPTTVVGLTNTTISTTQVVASVTGAVGSVTGAVGSVTGNVGGNVVGSVGSVTGNVGGNVTGSVGSVVAAVAITANVKNAQALANFEFLMTDSTNHNPAVGLAVTVTRSIDGGAFAAGTLSAVTEISAGIYAVNFGAGDLTGKVITLKATAAASDTRFVTLVTQP